VSLLDWQSALARIYLDSKLRRDIRNGDKSIQNEFRLTDAELDKLIKFVTEQGEQLESFATSLRRKRRERLNCYFPLFARYVGEPKWRVVIEMFTEQVPIPQSSATKDGLAFGRFVQGTDPPQGLDPTVFKDLVTYELSKLEVLEASPVVVEQAENDIESTGQIWPYLVPPARIRCMHQSPTVLARLAQGEVPTHTFEPGRRGLDILFFRSPRNEVCVAELGGYLGTVLRYSDGTEALDDLVERCNVSSPHKVSINAVFEALRKLGESGIVVLLTKARR
jgi:hypothetical protein